jgi:hypothetical protein
MLTLFGTNLTPFLPGQLSCSPSNHCRIHLKIIFTTQKEKKQDIFEKQVEILACRGNLSLGELFRSVIGENFEELSFVIGHWSLGGEVRRQKTEDGRQRTEDSGRKTVGQWVSRSVNQLGGWVT